MAQTALIANAIGITEYGVAAGYPRYPGPQKFPAL